MSRRRVIAAGVLIALLVAGVGSYYASSHPDGLEFVAGRTGFLDDAEDSPAVGGPLADYRTKGVENDRLSGGLAGIAGALAVLALGSGLFWVVRRRGASPSAPDEG
jgi:cobalt/nickel transport protein